MWQRFTERAKLVVIIFACEEAGKRGENLTSPEHLLLGITKCESCSAARILGSMGINLEAIRVEIENQIPKDDGDISKAKRMFGFVKDIKQTPSAKRVIAFARDEARDLGSKYVGTEHLLVGLVRENEGLAGQVLRKLGVDLETTRKSVSLLRDCV